MAIALALAFGAAGAQASHMTTYAILPTEHDDQGRSNEPDGARAGLYDKPLGDCSVDVTGDGRCDALDLARWPVGKVAAPGCSDGSGRRPSGICGIWTIGVGGPPLWGGGQIVPPGLIGVTSIPGGCDLVAARPLRLLDVHQRAMGFATIINPLGYPAFEVNRKLEDGGAHGAQRAFLGGASDAMAGPVGIYAWYGTYWDKNCNGVIDHFAKDHGARRDPANEFTWISERCTEYTDPYGPVRVDPDVCRIEPTEFLGWVVPGNHHTINGYECLADCRAVVWKPADLPGNLALCTLARQASDCDAWEAERAGDPLLGPQDSSAPDFYFYDYTGTLGDNIRTYIAADPHSMMHYDTSLFVTTTVVGAVNAFREGEGVYDLGRAAMVDVDVLKSLNPQLEAYLQGLVKPTARSTWLLVRGML